MSARVTVKRNELGRLAAGLAGATRDELAAAGRRVIARARPLTPVRSGRLRGSARVAERGDAVEVVWDAPYALFLEEGTRRGIRPRRFAARAGAAEAASLEAAMGAVVERV